MATPTELSLEGLDGKALRALSRLALKKAEMQERQVTSRHPSIAKLSDAVQATARELALKPAEVIDLVRRRLRIAGPDDVVVASTVKLDGTPRAKPGPKPQVAADAASSAAVAPKTKAVAGKKVAAPAKKAVTTAKKAAPAAKKTAPAKKAKAATAAPATPVTE